MYQKDISRIFKHLMLKYETQIAYQKKADRKLDRFGIMEITLLDYLRENGHAKQNELIAQLSIKRSKALSVLKKLMDAGYIKKEVNEMDRRSTWITLDLAGEKTLETYDRHESTFLDFVLKDMTINEEKTIVKFLSKINQTDYMK